MANKELLESEESFLYLKMWQLSHSNILQLICRYYQDPAAMANGVLPDGEESFADLKPGQLSQETRDALGLGPLDPPPWLDKMKQLGYPPMYK